jgi:hypothetical protein
MASDGWRPIETAPRDGTIIDLWSADEFGGRIPDCYWGFPEHTCGEAGHHCDSDWHSLSEGWVHSTFNVRLDDSITHWMPLPAPPKEDEA